MQPASQSIEGGKKRRSKRGKRSSSKNFGVRASGDFVPALIQPGELDNTLILGFWMTFNIQLNDANLGQLPGFRVTRPLVDAVADAARAAAFDYKTQALSEQTSMMVPANIRKFWRNVRIAAKPKVAFKSNNPLPQLRLQEVSVQLEQVGRDLETFRGVLAAAGGVNAAGVVPLPGLPPAQTASQQSNAPWYSAVHRILSAGPDFIAQSGYAFPGAVGAEPQNAQINSSQANPNNMFDAYQPQNAGIIADNLINLGNQAAASQTSILSLFLQEELLSLGLQPTLITAITAVNRVNFMVESGEVNPFLAY